MAKAELLSLAQVPYGHGVSLLISHLLLELSHEHKERPLEVEELGMKEDTGI